MHTSCKIAKKHVLRSRQENRVITLLYSLYMYNAPTNEYKARLHPSAIEPTQPHLGPVMFWPIYQRLGVQPIHWPHNLPAVIRLVTKSIGNQEGKWQKKIVLLLQFYFH